MALPPRSPRELALFAGAGGGLLASLLLDHRIVAACEFNPFRRELLLRRQRDGVWPMFPIWDDVRTLDGRTLRGLVDVVSGGFPCQPFSASGKRAGENDPRNMWPDTIRIIREVGPGVVFLENVPALLGYRYFGRILGDLAESGYDVVWDCISASYFGAPHQRDRLWIYGRHLDTTEGGRGGAMPRREDHPGRQLRGVQDRPPQHGIRPNPHDLSAHLSGLRAGEDGGERAGEEAVRREHSDPDEVGRVRRAELSEAAIEARISASEGNDTWWTLEPRSPLVADGVAQRVQRLESTGDGQVPLVAALAYRRLEAVVSTQDGLGPHASQRL